jgi:hypothetical protein
MTEYEELNELSFQTKLVYNFNDMHEFNRGLIRGYSLNDEDDKKMPRSGKIIEESLGHHANEEKMEIRKKIVFMLSTVKELMIDGLITDFSILESSLEQVFKNVVTKHTETNIRHAGRNKSEESG